MIIEKNENLANRICSVYIALCSNISNVAEGYSGQYFRSVVFLTGSWNEIYFTKGTASYEEPAKDSASGILYNQALKIFFPGSDPDNMEEFEAYIGKPIVVKFKYNNGKEKIIGDLDNPAKMLPSYSVGNKTGRVFDIKRQSELPALNYQEPI